MVVEHQQDERRRPTLPGDILRHEILEANGITQDALADASRAHNCCPGRAGPGALTLA